jgi:hypothetical protein
VNIQVQGTIVLNKIYVACSKKHRTFVIKTSFYNILSTVPFKVVPSTGDTSFPTFYPLLECFLERTFSDGAQFSYRIFLNLRVFKKRPNFLNSAPTSTEGALRLLRAPSGRFWEQTAICPVPLWALVVEQHPLNWASAQVVRRINPSSKLIPATLCPVHRDLSSWCMNTYERIVASNSSVSLCKIRAGAKSNLSETVAGFRVQSRRHFAWQPSARVSQTLWPTYLSHMFAAASSADQYRHLHRSGCSNTLIYAHAT